jgi:hypothetical protein
MTKLTRRRASRADEKRRIVLAFQMLDALTITEQKRPFTLEIERIMKQRLNTGKLPPDEEASGAQRGTEEATGQG